MQPEPQPDVTLTVNRVYARDSLSLSGMEMFLYDLGLVTKVPI